MSRVADGAGAAGGAVVDEAIIHEIDDAGRVTGEVDEGEGATGAASGSPASRTRKANTSDALTRANASAEVRKLRRERGCASDGRERRRARDD